MRSCKGKSKCNLGCYGEGERERKRREKMRKKRDR